MNGVANGLSSLSPVFIGLFISITELIPRLIMSGFTRFIAVVSAFVLTIKNINHSE